MRGGYVYKGPDVIPDPNVPLEVLNGDVPPESAIGPLGGGDPWGILMPTPQADVLNNGYRPEFENIQLIRCILIFNGTF